MYVFKGIKTDYFVHYTVNTSKNECVPAMKNSKRTSSSTDQKLFEELLLAA